MGSVGDGKSHSPLEFLMPEMDARQINRGKRNKFNWLAWSLSEIGPKEANVNNFYILDKETINLRGTDRTKKLRLGA